MNLSLKEEDRAQRGDEDDGGGSSGGGGGGFALPFDPPSLEAGESSSPSSNGRGGPVTSDDGGGKSALLASITTPFGKHIGRNRACESCRLRKLKCSGERPICGQCARAWSMRKRSLKGKGMSDEEMRDMEKPCVYMEVGARPSRTKNTGGGSRAAQMATTTTTHEKAETPLQAAQRERRRLERELAELKARFGLNSDGVSMTSMHAHEQQQQQHQQQQHFQPNSDELSIAQVLASTMRSAGGGGGGDGGGDGMDVFNGETGLSDKSLSSLVEGLAQRVTQSAAQDAQSLPPPPPSSTSTSGDASSVPIDPFLLSHASLSELPVKHSTSSSSTVGQADPLMELVLSGWPSDFPTVSTVNLLIHAFFEEFGYARLLFHPARFIDSVAQGPTSPRFPHAAVLHAIFALAYIARPDLDATPEAHRAADVQFAQASEDLLDDHVRRVHAKSRAFADPAYQAGQEEGITMALQSCSDRDRAKLGSAGYHSERAQYHMAIGMWEGGDLMSLAKAAFLLTTKRYGCGELFDAWMSACISTRLSVALAINRSHPTAPVAASSSSSKSTTPIDTVRLAMTGAPTDWIEEEERRRLMFLILATDRTACASTLWANSLDDADVTIELPLLTNSDFLRGDVAPSPSTIRQTLQSPDLFTANHIDGFNTMLKGCILMGRIASFLSRLPSFATEADMRGSSNTFDKLDNTLSAFSMSLPFRATDLDANGEVDVFRFVTYAVLHTNTLLLHGPLLRLNKHSEAMCDAACRSVLDLLRILIAAGVSFARLPPVLTHCLSMTGRVLVRRLQMVRARSTDNKDNDGDDDVRRSIDRFDMDVQHAGPFTWSFTPKQASTASSSSSSFGVGSSAGMGGATTSEMEEKLRGEIDLIFTYLCKVGQIWPMAKRQAQSLANMLGIDVAAPEALLQGIFTERNHSGHSYAPSTSTTA